jgi:hypothetical protein
MKSRLSRLMTGRRLRSSAFLRSAAVAALAVAGMAGGAGTGVAHAQDGTNLFCAYETTTYYCLDDWADGGQGNQVALGAFEAANEEFYEQVIPGRCGDGMVEYGGTPATDCPFTNPVFDDRYQGYDIVQLRYEGGYEDGYCLATGNGDGTDGKRGIIGSCNSPQSGIGGSNGSIFIDHNGYLINLYWSNIPNDPYGNNASCLAQVLNNGQPGAGSYVNLDLETTAGCTLWDSQLYD